MKTWQAVSIIVLLAVIAGLLIEQRWRQYEADQPPPAPSFEESMRESKARLDQIAAEQKKRGEEDDCENELMALQTSRQELELDRAELDQGDAGVMAKEAAISAKITDLDNKTHDFLISSPNVAAWERKQNLINLADEKHFLYEVSQQPEDSDRDARMRAMQATIEDLEHRIGADPAQ